MLRQFVEQFGGRNRAAVVVLMFASACASVPDPAGNAQSTGVDAVPSGSGGVVGKIPPPAAELYGQAVTSMEAGNTASAEHLFEAFLTQYPVYPGAYINLAIIQMGRDDFAAAESSLNRALEIDPKNVQAMNQLGMLLRRQGRLAEAESAYRRAVSIDPEYAIAHHNLGVLNDIYLRRPDVALSHYEQYRALAGEDPQVSKWIADLERRIGRNRQVADPGE